ncbi:Sec-independent protein translocase protein TatB [Pseudomonas mangrovi]|uniref:Sec-independent protein translocase protein TatB n=1 Tax=Pseudomonas mangrovi TaxID=2161748 RepID=A0A2T5P595_9PSED|nr:Sec-independent protein translocase protein TatB [Pseudomonas mangrovi]PTU72928.1 twin-arginine translocase subunit TatB [Pseudomonas mangrovi]
MFDVGFTELLLVGLVALLVLGPERLPVAARTAGLWIGRLKRSVGAIKAEVEREIGADEIRRQLHNERILELEREMNRNLLDDKLAEAPPRAEDAAPAAPAASAEQSSQDPPAKP